MSNKNTNNQDFVLEKSIFKNVFEKDIRRIFIYKKAERLAKALHLVSPAFSDSPSLRDRFDASAIALVEAAVNAPSAAKTALSRELLMLSSMLAIARTSGMLSRMNSDLIAHEVQNLLQEIAGYEEPHLFFDDSPSLAQIAKDVQKNNAKNASGSGSKNPALNSIEKSESDASKYKGQAKNIKVKNDVPISIKDRQESILSAIGNKGDASIKDISTLIRGVSEKTIQRELIALISSGKVVKRGERRWTTYSLVA